MRKNWKVHFPFILAVWLFLFISSNRIQAEEDQTELKRGTQENLNNQFMCSLLLASVGHKSFAALTMQNIITTMETYNNLRATKADVTKEMIKQRIASIRENYFKGVEISKVEAVFYLIGEMQCIDEAVVGSVFAPLHRSLNEQ